MKRLLRKRSYEQLKLKSFSDLTENRWQFLAVTGNITEDGEHVRAISAVINYLFLGQCNKCEHLQDRKS